MITPIQPWTVASGLLCDIEEWDGTINRITIGVVQGGKAQIIYCSDGLTHVVGVPYLRSIIIKRLGYVFSPIILN